jgi:hypothetical protein
MRIVGLPTRGLCFEHWKDREMLASTFGTLRPNQRGSCCEASGRGEGIMMLRDLELGCCFTHWYDELLVGEILHSVELEKLN